MDTEGNRFELSFDLPYPRVHYVGYLRRKVWSRLYSLLFGLRLPSLHVARRVLCSVSSRLTVSSTSSLLDLLFCSVSRRGVGIGTPGSSVTCLVGEWV